MANDNATLDQFLASVERRAFRMARFATGNTEDALDIVQDSMMNWVRKYAEHPEAEWRPLFFQVLQNRIRDWHRRQGVRNRWKAVLNPWLRDEETAAADPIAALPDPKGVNPGDQVEQSAAGAALDVALRALPLRQQQAFLLRAWEELSVGETARVMGCSEGSVKTHYSRAVQSLRTTLGDDWS